MEYHIDTIKKLSDWAHDFIQNLSQKNQAIIIRLSGDLGAGKTTLTQCLAQELGLSETITSPTFVIQKEYKVFNHDWIHNIIHIDAYRLERKEDLEYLGWRENIKNPKNLIIIEWPEMVEGIDMPEALSIHLDINKDHSRTIRVQHKENKNLL